MPPILRRLAQTPLFALLTLPAFAQTTHMVPVDKDVQLEVLDWGGAGRPIVLLTGLGDTAHVYDSFAPKLAQYHVYAITRRGFGASSVPRTGYTADRLGDDVIAVLDALQIPKPILAGHSIAGEELSSIVTRHPTRIAAAIYLDAALSFAFYNPATGDMNIDSLAIKRALQQLDRQPPEHMPIVHELLDTDFPAYERDLRQFEARFHEMHGAPQPPPQKPASAAPPPDKPQTPPWVFQAIMEGEQKFLTLPNVRLLAIYAMDPGHGKEEQSAAFEQANPSAPVVRLKNANHYVFLSNEAQVLQAMNDFIASLP